MIRQLIANFGQAGLPIVLWATLIGVVATGVLTFIRMLRGGVTFGSTLARSAGEIGIVVSLIAIGVVGLWSYHLSAARSLQFVPLIDFFHLPDDTPWWSPVEFALGNTLLFLPLGLSVQLRFRGLSLGRIALGAAALSALIEAWQWVFGTGRVASTDDIIFNTLGAVLGALLVRGIALLYRKPPPPTSETETETEAESGE